MRLSQQRRQEIKREEMELGDMMRAGALAEGMVSEYSLATQRYTLQTGKLNI